MSAPRLLHGRYEVGEVIGRGGMADVYEGYDTRLSRTVAVKLLRSDLARDSSFLTRFRREAQSAAGLNHPAIVAIYDSGDEPSVDARGAPMAQPFIVMELVEGRTLRQRIAEDGPLDPPEAARLTEQILGTFAARFRRGGRLGYWNLFVPRHRPESLAARLRRHEAAADALWRRDRAFFYGAFQLEELL